MIKNLLLPEKIGSYYLFPKRIVGFSFDSQTVYATKVYLKGTMITVENAISETISSNQDVSYEERIATSVKSIMDKIGKYDVIHSAFSSSQIIFKTLKLPFLNYEKIKMVVDYEVEPLLPFSLDESVIDFIITDQNVQDGSSEILVAAVQKSSISEHLLYFEKVDVIPQVIGIDLFSLYGLYRLIPSYNKIKGNVAFVDVSGGTTRIAFIQRGKLKAVRVLVKGIDDKESFLKSVIFTLNSFVTSKEGKLDFEKFIFSGDIPDSAGFTDFVTDRTQVLAEFFQANQLVKHARIKIKKTVSVSNYFATSFGVAFSTEVTSRFNLLPSHMSSEKWTSMLTKQVAFALFLIVALFGLLLTHSFMQVRKLNVELRESQEDVVMALKERFVIPEDEDDFEDVVDAAVREVTREENVWSPFSAQSQYLKYLLELQSLDLEDIGFEVDRIVFDSGYMTMEARVKDFQALNKLEKELRLSKLFKYEGSMQKTDFIMKIKLNRNG